MQMYLLESLVFICKVGKVAGCTIGAGIVTLYLSFVLSSIFGADLSRHGLVSADLLIMAVTCVGVNIGFSYGLSLI